MVTQLQILMHGARSLVKTAAPRAAVATGSQTKLSALHNTTTHDTLRGLAGSGLGALLGAGLGAGGAAWAGKGTPEIVGYGAAGAGAGSAAGNLAALLYNMSHRRSKLREAAHKYVPWAFDEAEQAVSVPVGVDGQSEQKKAAVCKLLS